MIEALIIVVIVIGLALYIAVRRSKRSDSRNPEDIYPLW